MAEKKIYPINKRIGEYKKYNAQPVLLAVEKWIRILEARKRYYAGSKWLQRYYCNVPMREVCYELSIFDWWVEKLTLSRLKEMRTFLREAIKLGYTGYVCFKVGAEGCANGMWANKVPTTNGYSPKGEFLYKSFTPSYNYWDICDYSNGYGETAFKLSEKVGKEFDALKTKKDLENALADYRIDKFREKEEVGC